MSHTYGFLVGAISAQGLQPDVNNGLGGGPVLPPPPGVYLSPTRIMDPPRATPILCQMKSAYLFRSPIYDFLGGGYNYFNSDVSKQVRLCVRLHEQSEVHLDMLSLLGQSTQ